MTRYLDSKGLATGLAELYKGGENVNFLAEEGKVFAWADKGSVLSSTREKSAFHVASDRAVEVGIAFVTPRPSGVNLSGGVLTLRYQSTEEVGVAVIAIKPAMNPLPPGLIAKEIFVPLSKTGGRDEEVRVQLPTTPGLTRIKEVVVTLGPVRRPGRSASRSRGSGSRSIEPITLRNSTGAASRTGRSSSGGLRGGRRPARRTWRAASRT